MDRFPQELIFALIVGAVLLVQFVLKRLRKRTPQADAEADVGFEPDTLIQGATAAEAPRPARPEPTPPPPRSAPAPAQRDARRFTRRSLMGSRRAVQDAIVVAAILGPCRAYRPHDID